MALDGEGDPCCSGDGKYLVRRRLPLERSAGKHGVIDKGPELHTLSPRYLFANTGASNRVMIKRMQANA